VQELEKFANIGFDNPLERAFCKSIGGVIGHAGRWPRRTAADFPIRAHLAFEAHCRTRRAAP